MSTEQFVCINNDGYPVALELFRAHDTIPDDGAAERALIRVIDESGEDYLYLVSRFVSADVPPAAYDTLSKIARQVSASADDTTGAHVRGEYSTLE